MRKTNRNIIELYEEYPDSYIVVPTNLGFTKEGKNVMGAGLAKQVNEYFYKKLVILDMLYGRKCKKKFDTGDNRTVDVIEQYRLILFATKPCNIEKPWLSWKQDSCLGLIELGLEQLAFLIKTRLKDKLIFIPLVGSGNGNLDAKTVLVLLKKFFKDNHNIVLCDVKLK